MGRAFQRVETALADSRNRQGPKLTQRKRNARKQSVLGGLTNG